MRNLMSLNKSPKNLTIVSETQINHKSAHKLCLQNNSKFINSKHKILIKQSLHLTLNGES